MLPRSLPVIALWAIGLSAPAQPVVDITLVPVSATQVEVRLRPDGDFAEFFAASVFTVRWPDGAGTLGAIVQSPGVAVYHAVARSGLEQVDAGYRYQIFAGFGGATMADAGASWTANEEVVLCRLNSTGDPATFQLVNDPWTEANNGSFYISLNGLDRTGGIYGDGLTSVVEEQRPPLTVRPDPSTGRFFITLPPQVQVRDLQMTDASGRIRNVGTSIMSDALVVDLSGVEAGVYLLRMGTTAGVRVVRLVRAGDRAGW